MLQTDWAAISCVGKAERALRDTIAFFLGSEERRIRCPAPSMTVLDWLRGEALATGTKEGCGDGDCGACTVVIQRPGGEYRAVNSCIMLLPQLDGSRLLTVENLRGQDGALHPVQRAMVERHGSQCGFCTPGIVMSLFALRQQGEAAPSVTEALAGNLCRCTGYRSIIDAAHDCCDGQPDEVDREADQWLARHNASPVDFDHQAERYSAPSSLNELAETLQRRPEATLLAGGTDLGVWLAKRHSGLPFILSVNRVAELSNIEIGADAILIGAAASYERCLPVVTELWPHLGVMMRRLGSPQIRNLGTIGGNLATASPIGDMAPALLALDAKLHLRRGAETRALPLSEFFTGYRRTALAAGEFIAAIEIARPAPDSALKVFKVSKRLDEDISTVCAGFHLRLAGGVVREFRAAWGGVAATPVRTEALEQAVIGRTWDAATVEAGMALLDAQLTPLSDARASATYRRAVARNLLLKLYLETAGAGRPARVGLRAA